MVPSFTALVAVTASAVSPSTVNVTHIALLAVRCALLTVPTIRDVSCSMHTGMPTTSAINWSSSHRVNSSHAWRTVDGMLPVGCGG